MDMRHQNGGGPRTGGRLQQVDALLDGNRTAAEIALILDVAPEYVRATVKRQGWQERLKRGKGGLGSGVPATAFKSAPVTHADPAAPTPDALARAEDERTLSWIADRLQGVPVSAIARAAGVTPAVVQARTSAVRNADIDESGEPPLTVGRAYLWSRR